MAMRKKAELQVSPGASNVSPNMQQSHYGNLKARASTGYYRTFYLASGLSQDHPLGTMDLKNA